MLWCLDVLVVRPMFIFTEIAGADLSYYKEKLSKFYGMWPIKVDPFEAGLPLRRVRLYVFMWCKLRAFVSGSEKEYVSLTRRKVMMKGEDLMSGDDELRWKISRDNAERHGYVYGQRKQSEDFPVIPFQHQVTAQTFQRYQDQVRQYEMKGGCLQHGIFDCDHNASHTAGGWVIPTCRCQERTAYSTQTNPKATHPHPACGCRGLRVVPAPHHTFSETMDDDGDELVLDFESTLEEEGRLHSVIEEVRVGVSVSVGVGVGLVGCRRGRRCRCG